MKVCILSESPADDAAAKVLTEAVLGAAVELVAPARFAPGGWGKIPGSVATQLRFVHYRTDADALIIWADSDDSPPHGSHPPPTHPRCRHCILSEIIRETQATLTPVPSRAPVKTAIALAVPAAEAWYRCGVDVHATELHFLREFAQGHGLVQERRRLKQDVYGTDAPSLSLETTRAVEEARRLAQDLTPLRTYFAGFEMFAQQILQW